VSCASLVEKKFSSCEAVGRFALVLAALPPTHNNKLPMQHLRPTVSNAKHFFLLLPINLSCFSVLIIQYALHATATFPFIKLPQY
jgi:hypothetical protein